MGELVRAASSEHLDRRVPTCPGWTVRDVVAHVSGVCSDVLAGRIEGVATDPWTARQVDDRRGWPIGRVLDEWAFAAGQLEPVCEDVMGPAAGQWLSDLVTHEHDVRCALGVPGARDDDAVAVAFRWLTSALGRGFEPPLRLVTDEGDDVVVGDGAATGTVRASRFELMRAMTGRRSESQIAAFAWDADHRRFLHAFARGPFSIAATDIEE